MDIQGRKVLVTGAGGFIGSHLVEQLIDLGCDVTAFIHYNSFNRWGWLDFLSKHYLDSMRVISGDIRDPNGIREAMTNSSVVFHLAALIGIPFSYHSPDTYVDTNIRGTLNVLQAARTLEIEKVIHTSTSEVYGTAQFVPITEEHPVNPQSPYAATKLGADFLALTFHRSFKFPVSVVRPFNTYGPRQSARAIIPTIITQSLAGIQPISLGSLSPTRDLTFVKDTVDGFIQAASSDEGCGQVTNLGSGFEISIGDLVNRIAGILGKPIEVVCTGERIRPEKSEVERLWASNQNAQTRFNWKPRYTIEQGLRKTVQWFLDPQNQIFYKSNIYNI